MMSIASANTFCATVCLAASEQTAAEGPATHHCDTQTNAIPAMTVLDQAAGCHHEHASSVALTTHIVKVTPAGGFLDNGGDVLSLEHAFVSHLLLGLSGMRGAPPNLRGSLPLRI